MRIGALLCALLMMAMGDSAHPEQGARLEGCPQPDTLVKALAKLRDADWDDLPSTRLQSMWPIALEGQDCTSGGCSSLADKGRIISGRCLCCDSFYFEVTQNKNRAKVEKLDALVIYYSAPEEGEVVGVARDLARVAGLAEDKVATVGHDSRQDFSWQDARKTHISLLNLKLLHQRSVCTLYFYFSRHIM